MSILEQTMLAHLRVVLGCFSSAKTELSSCNTDFMACKAQGISPRPFTFDHPILEPNLLYSNASATASWFCSLGKLLHLCETRCTHFKTGKRIACTSYDNYECLVHQKCSINVTIIIYILPGCHCT